MLNLEAKIRNNKNIEPGNIMAVLYGPKIENTLLQVEKNVFEKGF